MAGEAEAIVAAQEPRRDTAAPLNLVRHRGLLFALAAILLVFLLGITSWVRFFLAPASEGGAAGNRAVLFTSADYPAIALASRLVSSGHGAQLYDFKAQLQEQNKLFSEGYIVADRARLAYPYPYAPFIAVLWSPLSGVSPLTGMALWDLLNIAGMAGGLWFLLASLPLLKVTRLVLLLAAVTSLPFIVNLQQGQSSGATMLGLAVGVALLRRGRDLPAGMAFGLLLLKIQWLPLLGVALLWKRRWRALLGLAVTGAALMAITLLTMGTGWIEPYIGVVARAQKFDSELLLDPGYSHSLTGALFALLGMGNGGLISLLNSAATLLLAGLLLYLWRKPWQPGTAQWDAQMAVTVLAAIFTTLQLNTHDLSLLVLPAALGLSYVNAADAGGRMRPLRWYGWCGLIWADYLLTALLPPGAILAMPLVRLSAWLIGAMLAVLAVWVTRKQSAADRKLYTSG